MKGRRQIKPTRVFQAVTDSLNQRVTPTLSIRKPIWYDVMVMNPPSQTLIRTLPPQHQKRDPKTRKPTKVFKPQHLTYPEDALRKQFYQDHPWELARPRMMVETDGRDHERFDWSKGLRQPGMPLCGESVVQRQMWMMDTNPQMTKAEAYDIVRKEFYALRHEEDVERRIAVEEARYVGAYFGKSMLQVGMELENKEYSLWQKWAGKQIDALQAEKDAAYTSFGQDDEKEKVSEDQLEQMAQEDAEAAVEVQAR